jgi:hypothetical protein
MTEKKRFIIRKYVMAKSASDAINQDKKTQVDDVWVDEKWNDENIKKSFIGFKDKK